MKFPSSVVNLGYILSLYAEIESKKIFVDGMKILNEERLSEGMSPAYNQQHFDDIADEIESIALSLRNI